MASLILMGRIEEGREHFWSAFAANRKNAYWGNLVKRERVFPQYGIFRNAMLELFRDGMQPLRAAADLQIGIVHPQAFYLPGWHLVLAHWPITPISICCAVCTRR